MDSNICLHCKAVFKTIDELLKHTTNHIETLFSEEYELLNIDEVISGETTQAAALAGPNSETVNMRIGFFDQPQSKAPTTQPAPLVGPNSETANMRIGSLDQPKSEASTTQAAALVGPNSEIANMRIGSVDPQKSEAPFVVEFDTAMGEKVPSAQLDRSILRPNLLATNLDSPHTDDAEIYHREQDDVAEEVTIPEVTHFYFLLLYEDAAVYTCRQCILQRKDELEFLSDHISLQPNVFIDRWMASEDDDELKLIIDRISPLANVHLYKPELKKS